MSGASKRDVAVHNRRRHAQQRAKERYDEQFSYDELALIDKRVQDNAGVLLRRVSDAKTEWLIEWKERVYKVGYDSDTQQVTTFLPIPNASNDIMLQMYDALKKKKE